jgi:pimeloyl-ACP methyl ester carboxylesterase
MGETLRSQRLVCVSCDIHKRVELYFSSTVLFRQGEARGDAEPPPTLIVHGDRDVVIPPANARALAGRWPGARVELFAGCGHALMAQEPQRIAELIRLWSKRNFERGRRDEGAKSQRCPHLRHRSA